MYGRPDAPLSPTPAAVDADPDDPRGVLITFHHTGHGLRTADGQPPRAVTLAGNDGTFHPAPATVRYAHDNHPDVNLTNDAPLPATPFVQTVDP